MEWGYVIGLLGVALCVLLCGIGSAIGLKKTGQAAAGILSEDPKKFSKALVLVVLPATQGIYGFVFGIIAMSSLSVGMPVYEGFQVFLSALPLTIIGLFSAVLQGATAASCIHAVAKKESLSGKLILFPAMVETYAILALVISLLLIA